MFLKRMKKAIIISLSLVLLIPAVSCNEKPNKNGTLRDLLMKEAQIVTDFMRDQKFKYGDASINPAYNWKHLDPSKADNPDEKIVSCDRLVDWILYRAGFTNQPYEHGDNVWSLIPWCEDHYFNKITNPDELREGDIVFVNPDKNNMPAHVFMCASTKSEDGTYLRYDAGSNERIQCVKGTEENPGEQPFREYINNFMFAYRPNDHKLKVKYEDDDSKNIGNGPAAPDIDMSIEIKKGTATVDGVIGDGEYKSSYIMGSTNCSAWRGSMNDKTKTKIYFAWDDSGLYYAAEINDSTPSYRGDESWVGADCLQLGVDPGELLRGRNDSGIFFTFGAKADGTVVTYRHNYGEGLISDKVTAVANGHTAGSDSYIIEAFIPWSAMQLEEDGKDTTGFKAKSGVKINVLPCVIDSTENESSILAAYKYSNTTFETIGYVPGVLK